MPTARGLLRKGDQIRHESGQVLIVLARIGDRKKDYSVKVRKPDGSRFGSNGKDTLTVPHADWFITHSGKWEVVPEEAVT